MLEDKIIPRPEREAFGVSGKPYKALQELQAQQAIGARECY
jgi:hypothetical protein